ncbi:MAG: hypothetical protein ACKVT1_07525 [Dehalococcoidia bacterium]
MAEQISKLVEWGRGLQIIRASAHLPGPADRAKWMIARAEVLEWARAVTRKVDRDRADRLPWHAAQNVVWSENAIFDASVAAAVGLEVRVRVWADEVEILSEPSAETVIVEPDTPFSSWQRIADIIRTAKREVWAMDPYLTDQALPLFLQVAGEVAVRLVSRDDQTPSQAGWTKFCAERGGSSKLRLSLQREMVHDRFFGIDDRVFLSGASLKDVGKRFSVLIELTDPEVADQVRARFEHSWATSIELPV